MNTTRDQNYYRALRDRLGILSSDDLSVLICVSPKTLQKWRSAGRGPAFFYVNRNAFYRLVDIASWLDARVTGSPADMAPELEQDLAHEHDETDASDIFSSLEEGASGAGTAGRNEGRDEGRDAHVAA